MLGLTNDDLSTTTRSVRRRRDLERPVSRGVAGECVEIALQAPGDASQQAWRWIAVDDLEPRAAVASEFAGAMADGSRSGVAIADGCVWWNPLPHVPGAEGIVDHRGKAAVMNVVMGAGTDHSARGIDSDDLATVGYHDALTLCDGRFVLRQHRHRVKTRAGRGYESHSAFVVEFDEDAWIRRIWEHRDTLTATLVPFRRAS